MHRGKQLLEKRCTCVFHENEGEMLQRLQEQVAAEGARRAEGAASCAAVEESDVRLTLLQ